MVISLVLEALDQKPTLSGTALSLGSTVVSRIKVPLLIQRSRS